MKSFLNYELAKVLCLFCLIGLGYTVDAQDEPKKKAVIVTKKIDENGKEITERIELDVDDAENTDIEALIEMAKREAKKMDATTVEKMGAKPSKRAVITIKKVDKEGKEYIEKMVVEGEEVDEAFIEELIGDAKEEVKEIDVEIEEDISVKQGRKTKEKSVEKNIWIEKDGEEIDLDNIKGEHIIIIKDDEVTQFKGDADEEMEVRVMVDDDGNTKIIKKRKKVMDKGEDIEAKLEEMGIQLPTLGAPIANYVHAVQSNNWVFLAGKGPRKADGKNIVGKLGEELTVEQGYEAARWAGINLLAALKGEIGDLNRVVRIVKVKGMVNAVPEFTDHSKVINGFSDLMVAVFGDKGRHARAAVGMNSLPGNMAVEIEMIVEVE